MWRVQKKKITNNVTSSIQISCWSRWMSARVGPLWRCAYYFFKIGWKMLKSRIRRAELKTNRPADSVRSFVRFCLKICYRIKVKWKVLKFWSLETTTWTTTLSRRWKKRFNAKFCEWFTNICVNLFNFDTQMSSQWYNNINNVLCYILQIGFILREENGTDSYWASNEKKIGLLSGQ